MALHYYRPGPVRSKVESTQTVKPDIGTEQNVALLITRQLVFVSIL